MGSKLLFNKKAKNHMAKLKGMAKLADTAIIVSPFLSDNLSGIIEQMPTIKNITLYTCMYVK